MTRSLLYILLFFAIALYAEVENRFIDIALIESPVKIIDIRTPSEWKETGLVKGSIPIMFFDERGNYDLKGFINTLNTHIKPKEKFALICNSGSRTSMLSGYLSKELGYDVINLKGGIQYAIGKKLPIEPYKP